MVRLHRGTVRSLVNSLSDSQLTICIVISVRRLLRRLLFENDFHTL
jgi:hypothetical protein